MLDSVLLLLLPFLLPYKWKTHAHPRMTHQHHSGRPNTDPTLDKTSSTIKSNQLLEDGIEPEPGPEPEPEQGPKPRTLRCMSWNAGGLTGPKKGELKQVLEKEKYDVVHLQELMAAQTGKLNFDGYRTFLRVRTVARKKDISETHGGGIATLVKKNLRATEQPFEAWETTERLDVIVEGVLFTNVYRPSGVGLQKGDQREDDFATQDLPTGEGCVIAGDINAHHQAWSQAKIPNQTGTDLHDWALGNNMRCWNKKEATRIQRGTKTSPDVVFADRDWADPNWQTRETLNSDHLPIEFEVQANAQTPPTHPEVKLKKELWNWKKANWAGFTKEMERSSPDAMKWGSISTAAAKWAGMVKNIARRHIPRGKARKKKRRWCNGAVKKAQKQRDRELRRQQKEETLTVADGDALTELRRQTANAIRKAKREVWEDKCTKAVATSGAFRLLRELDGRADKAQSYPIKVKKEGQQEKQQLSTNKEKADALGEHYCSVSDGTGLPDAEQQTTAGSQGAEAPLTLEELDAALNVLEAGKSPGADGIHNEMLMHLGPAAKKGLLHVMNLSWKQGQLPKEWKKAILFPIHKQGKPEEDLESYRPIALTSTVSKVMEHVLANRLLQLMEDPNEATQNLHPKQTGFRRFRSAVDNLAYITQLAKDSAAKKEVPIILTLDLDKAYDKVKRGKILERLHQHQVPERYIRWLTDYLKHRTARTTVEGTRSEEYVMREGVPQGTVLSPLLFNLVMTEVAEILEGTTAHFCIFADDLAIMCTERTLEEATAAIQKVLTLLEEHLPKLGFTISRRKTFVMPVTEKGDRADIRKAKCEVKYADGAVVNRAQTVRYLGVELDDALTMQPQLAAVKTKFLKKLSLIQLMAGRDWGCDAHMLRQVYMTYVLPTITYALAVWGPALNEAGLETLEVLHRRGARVITGCNYYTKAEDLLWEAHLRKIREHVEFDAAALYERARRQLETPAECAMHSSDTKLTWLRSAKDTVEQTKMYRHDQPAMSQTHYPVAPWRWKEVLPKVDIRPYVAGFKKGTQTDAEARSLTEQTIAELPPADLHVYTDGSVEGGRGHGGAGIVVYPGDSDKEIATANVGAGRMSISYTAELVAIREALPMVEELHRTDHKHNTVVILTDSQSALRALETGPVKATGLLCDVWSALHRATTKVRVIMQYIPSHVGVSGNEEADHEAKLGTATYQAERASQKGRLQEEPLTLLACKAAIRAVCSSYTPQPASELYSTITADTPKGVSRPKLSTPELTRRGAVQMRLLRTERHPALFDYMGSNDVARCNNCTAKAKATLKHMFKVCSATKALRTDLLPNKSLKFLLLEQPQLCLKYISAAKLTEASLPELVRSNTY